MNPEDEKILEVNGWSVDCYSPFEISNGESFASNAAAEMVLWYLKDNYPDGDDEDAIIS